MFKPLLLVLVLAVPLLAAGCDGGSDHDHEAGRGPYLSGGFGVH